jgi:hypothetical protein
MEALEDGADFDDCLALHCEELLYVTLKCCKEETRNLGLGDEYSVVFFLSVG